MGFQTITLSFSGSRHATTPTSDRPQARPASPTSASNILSVFSRELWRKRQGLWLNMLHHHQIQPLIRKFEWRARRRQAGAYGFFVLMLAGGWRCGMGLCPREGNYGQGTPAASIG